jgi:hypothetical protein
MTKRRNRIPLPVQLAAALCQLVDAKGERLIPHEHAKLMTPDQVISLFQRDHYPIPKASPFNGPDEHWNIEFRLIAGHAHKTNKDNGTGRSDRKVIARTRKTIKKQTELISMREAKELGERDGKVGFKRRWPKRKLQSRNTFQTRKPKDARAS